MERLLLYQLVNKTKQKHTAALGVQNALAYTVPF